MAMLHSSGLDIDRWQRQSSASSAPIWSLQSRAVRHTHPTRWSIDLVRRAPPRARGNRLAQAATAVDGDGPRGHSTTRGYLARPLVIAAWFMCGRNCVDRWTDPGTGFRTRSRPRRAGANAVSRRTCVRRKRLLRGCTSYSGWRADPYDSAKVSDTLLRHLHGLDGMGPKAPISPWCQAQHSRARRDDDDRASSSERDSHRVQRRGRPAFDSSPQNRPFSSPPRPELDPSPPRPQPSTTEHPRPARARTREGSLVAT